MLATSALTHTHTHIHRIDKSTLEQFTLKSAAEMVCITIYTVMVAVHLTPATSQVSHVSQVSQVSVFLLLATPR